MRKEKKKKTTRREAPAPAPAKTTRRPSSAPAPVPAIETRAQRKARREALAIRDKAEGILARLQQGAAEERHRLKALGPWTAGKLPGDVFIKTNSATGAFVVIDREEWERLGR